MTFETIAPQFAPYQIHSENPHGRNWKRIQSSWIEYKSEPWFLDNLTVEEGLGDGAVYQIKWEATRQYTATVLYESVEGYRALYGWSVRSQSWHCFQN